MDPLLDLKKSPKQPQTWNRYAYVHGNPLVYTDPNGRCAEDLCVGEAIVGAVIAIESPAGQNAIRAGEQEISELAESLAPEAEGLLSKAEKMAEVVTKGRLGEKLAGIVQRTKEGIVSLSRTARIRIPDGLDHEGKILTEVKNLSGKVNLTRQINDFVLWAQKQGYSVVLWLKDTSKVSSSVQKLVDSGAIVLKQLPPH